MLGVLDQNSLLTSNQSSLPKIKKFHFFFANSFFNPIYVRDTQMLNKQF